MEKQQIVDLMIKMKDADLEMRERLIRHGILNDGYDAEMEFLHIKNAEILSDIIDKIGYPTESKVGKEAADAAWLVIQHSISKPEFMRRCADLLKQEVELGTGNAVHLAYLTDRIAALEGRPQYYGTQFDIDENGELSPMAIEDAAGVNERRTKIGLNTIDEQTLVMRRQAKDEGQKPPQDLKKRAAEYAAWNKRVGWTK